jgi:hypothetical protein
MIREDKNILEAGKAGGITLGFVEKSTYIEKFFSTTTEIIGIPLFGKGGGAGK